MIEQTPNAPPAEATVQKTVEDCQRYRDKLYWRCRLYFRDWPDYAEDCVQEAYIELMQALRAGRRYSQRSGDDPGGKNAPGNAI